MLIGKLQKKKGSYYVYLPKDWCKKITVKANDLLNIEELSDGSLIIRPHDQVTKEKPTIKIELTDKLDGKILKQIIKAAYAIGVDSLEIKTSANIKLFELTELIIKILTSLPGFEIVEEFENKIKIQNTGLGFDIVMVMRKLFTTVYNMLSSLSEAIKNSDLKLTENIIARDNEVDRNYMIAERLSHLSVKNPSLLWDNKI
ncbi:MAG: phosphate uptake regulator PhoU, partial [Candidatus Odinarchaeota archaeon]